MCLCCLGYVLPSPTGDMCSHINVQLFHAGGSWAMGRVISCIGNLFHVCLTVICWYCIKMVAQTELAFHFHVFLDLCYTVFYRNQGISKNKCKKNLVLNYRLRKFGNGTSTIAKHKHHKHWQPPACYWRHLAMTVDMVRCCLHRPMIISCWSHMASSSSYYSSYYLF